MEWLALRSVLVLALVAAWALAGRGDGENESLGTVDIAHGVDDSGPGAGDWVSALSTWFSGPERLESGTPGKGQQKPGEPDGAEPDAVYFVEIPTPEGAEEAGAGLDAPEPLDEQVDGWVTLDDLSFYVCRGAPPGFEDGFCGGAGGNLGLEEGQVACGYAWSLGTQFQIYGDPTNRIYICNDRGLGPTYWLDVFFWEYADGRAWRDSIPYPWRIRVIAP